MNNNNNRIWEIDFLRGICITGMIFNHFLLSIVLFYWDKSANGILGDIIKFANFAYSTGNYIKQPITYIVLSIFFIISGISSNLSNNNKKRLIKLGVMTIFMLFFCIIISKIFTVDIITFFGVFACYFCCLLIYIIILEISKKINSKSFFYVVFFLLIIASAIIIIFKPYAENTNIFMFLGIPKKNSYLGFEYFPIFPWIGIYGIGVIGGRIIYRSKRTLLPFNYLHKEFFSFIGRNGLKAYILQIPFLFFIVNLIDIIFTKIT